MMTVTQEQEAPPASYPAAPDGLSTAAAAITPAAVWKRIESWIARRYPARSVTWIVEGCGQFVPRLTPAVMTKAERWDNGAWLEFQPPPGPRGYCLDGGVYRLTFDVGEATPPGAVQEAYKRLAEYWAEAPSDAGLTSITDGDYSMTRSANTVANALQYSGAADLLQGYRQ